MARGNENNNMEIKRAKKEEYMYLCREDYREEIKIRSKIYGAINEE